MDKTKKFNHTTRVEAAIENIEAVLKKSRKSLLDDDIRLLEESLNDLKSIKSSYQKKQVFSKDDLILISRIVIQLLRFFDIDCS